MMFEEVEGGESLPLPAHDILVRRRNPGASRDLIIPFVTECNTNDEQIMANIMANSAVKGRRWVAQVEAHGGVALICGSGPSLADGLEEIRRAARRGATVIALNGAADFLARHDIEPDYQFIIDARQENIDLLSVHARRYVLASQVDPSMFAAAPSAYLAQVGVDAMEFLPEHASDFAVIFGHSSCGNVAPGLAYTLGFRDIHCYGYDSSHRDGEGHPFRQPMNDGEPLMWLERRGKRYLTSFTMRQQADVFPGIARELQALGCRLTVHGEGLLPDTWNAPPMSEREKYERLWAMPEYRVTAPGEACVYEFVRAAKPAAYSTVLDLGCGTGRASVAMNNEHALCPMLVDFTDNSRDPEARYLPFWKCDLAEPLPVHAEYGFCTDVMEHIPSADTETVLTNIFASAPNVFFQIDTQPDNCGVLIGETLHINLRSHDEWRGLLSQHGEITYEREAGGSSIFYVTKDQALAGCG